MLSGLFEFLGNILSFINPFSENFFAYKLVDLLINGLKALFIPSDTYFSTKFDSLKQAFANKLSYNSYISVFDNLQNVEVSKTTVNISNYNVGGLNISSNNFINFDFITQYKDIWFAWIRAILFIGLVIYNINQIYKLIRGGDMVNSGGGNNDN